jgi:hypothetical protein
MRPEGIVVTAPVLDDNLALAQLWKELAVEQFVTQVCVLAQHKPAEHWGRRHLSQRFATGEV